MSTEPPPNKKAKMALTVMSATAEAGEGGGGDDNKKLLSLSRAIETGDAAALVRILSAQPELADQPCSCTFGSDGIIKCMFPIEYLIEFKQNPPTLEQLQTVGNLTKSNFCPIIHGAMDNSIVGKVSGVVEYLCQRFHCAAKSKNYGKLPIHRILESSGNPSLSQIKALVEAYPKCLSDEKCLSLAFYNPDCSLEIVQYLTEQFATGATKGNNSKRLVLQHPRKLTSKLSKKVVIDMPKARLLVKLLSQDAVQRFITFSPSFTQDAWNFVLQSFHKKASTCCKSNCSKIVLESLTFNIHHPAGPYDVPTQADDSLLNIVANNAKVKALRIFGYPFALSDVTDLAEALRVNTNLRTLTLSGIPPKIQSKARTLLEQVMLHHNYTIERFVTEDFTSPKLNWLARMNHYGRARVRHASITPATFVNLLLAVMGEEPLMHHNLMFGLLLESPSLWSGMFKRSCCGCFEIEHKRGD